MTTDVERRYFCNCTGKPIELIPVETEEEEVFDLICQRCGASPSSDPKHTISYQDVVYDD
ncbi:MAG: hypothetical protein D6751_02940 [Deltaproteobacteria bacterium]|nr:MAG: hypothetical protein D6751_02940 [Deltaproteobacteria bacterium]